MQGKCEHNPQPPLCTVLTVRFNSVAAGLFPTHLNKMHSINLRAVVSSRQWQCLEENEMLYMNRVAVRGVFLWSKSRPFLRQAGMLRPGWRGDDRALA